VRLFAGLPSPFADRHELLRVGRRHIAVSFDVPAGFETTHPMLILSHVVKRYGAHVAVNDLSLEVRPGEIFGLLGPNGAGKSTSVHLAVGLLRPDQGMAALAGLGPPTSPDVRARIGVAPQALSLYQLLTGEENLTFFGRLHGMKGSALAGRVRWALDFVGLTDRRGDRVQNYSGGMKRRLNLAAALLHAPALLLLDEPTVGVDPQSRNSIFDNIEALREQGTTILYTTHYMEEAVRLCDRVAIIDHGRLLALDTVRGLIAEYGGAPTLVVEIGEDVRRIETANPLAELNRFVAEGATVTSFHVERPTLEQVFLNLTGRSLRD
jgi:ABC-2 type transport system ATP-binding protein